MFDYANKTIYMYLRKNLFVAQAILISVFFFLVFFSSENHRLEIAYENNLIIKLVLVREEIMILMYCKFGIPFSVAFSASSSVKLLRRKFMSFGFSFSLSTHSCHFSTSPSIYRTWMHSKM